MSVSSEITRINNAVGDIKDHVSTLGVDTTGNIEQLAQNITVLAKPNGNQGQIVGFTGDNEIGAVNLPSDLQGAIRYTTPRWLRFDPSNRKGLVIKGGTSIRLKNGGYANYEEDTSVDLSYDVTAAGADYFVYISDDKEIHAYTAKQSTGVYIGRFHTLCADVFSLIMIAPASPSSGLAVGGEYLVKSYSQTDDADFYNFYNKNITAVTKGDAYDVVTCQHPLTGFSAGDILPESVFCLTFHPECLVEDAMVFDKDTGICVDVYLQSGTGFNTRSKYNAVHTVSRTAGNHAEDMRMVGKRLLRDFEFTSASIGSNQKTNIYGSTDKSKVGGNFDTASIRMISAIGCEEMCGYLWQWLDEIAPAGGSAWADTDKQGAFGQEYGTPYVLLAGGDWSLGASCGSRSRASHSVRSAVYTPLGGRGSSRVIRGI